MFGATKAIEMIGIDRARGLDLFVKRTTNLVARRERQRHQLKQRRNIVGQIVEKVLVVLAIDRDRIVDLADVLASILEENVDRVSSAASLESPRAPVQGVRRPFRRGQIMRPDMDFAAQRQSLRPGWGF